MMLEHKSQLFVNELVMFSYHGKPRSGRVEATTPEHFTIDFGDYYKRFRWDKVDHRTNQHTGIKIFQRSA